MAPGRTGRTLWCAPASPGPPTGRTPSGSTLASSSNARRGRSQAGEHLGDQLARVVAVDGFGLELVEELRVERDLPRAGHLDRGGRGFQSDSVVVEDPESNGGDGVPLDVGRDERDGGAFGPHGDGGIGVVGGVEEFVPEREHPLDVRLGLEDAGQDDRLVDAEMGGAPVGGDRVRATEAAHASSGLAGPLEVSRLYVLRGGDQVRDLVLGAASDTPVPDVALGGRLDAVLDAADACDVLAGRVGERLAGQPRGLAELTQPGAEFLAGLCDGATRVDSHEMVRPAPKRSRTPLGRSAPSAGRRWSRTRR